ncbi:hypothetical protein SAMN00768000_1360 [Sulfobacillus thermosulfidooxidans DSM 9293]|uniref:Uncharacterized protein n=1 Tax=Sulfobacillus thermosulfidooxidans (strain DSM 9293 / VKM B-1269 / AT-1) TaxID=929705 RepID=A0A1W1WCB8_SULTA|nr:hypothetical protein [Sulfobacillus thermosulfidooxidans]SMC03927.1 hypothetical protein SAMN00768000_1360 [Sulfobacillus thermosulfidooxidans DSM 9293]
MTRRSWVVKNITLASILLILWMLSEFMARRQYHPFRDDWFTLGFPNFWAGGNRWQFYLDHHLDAYRPLSFLIDIELWSRFWPHEVVVAFFFFYRC